MKYGLTPGGEIAGVTSGTGRQSVHMASTLPSSNSEIVSGYRTGSQICININVESYIEEGGQIWCTSNRVLNAFEPIPSFFLCAIDTTNGWDYCTNAPAEQLWLDRPRPIFSPAFVASKYAAVSRE